MSSPRSSAPALVAPGAATSSQPAYAPGRYDRLPAVDDRLVAPESHAQIVGGVVIETMGANEPHAVEHTEVAHVFRGCLAEGYRVAVDMLTRTSRDTDAAPDVSVFPIARDPATGGRQLEEIAFEVVDSERMNHAARKARRFIKRGVRRVFAVRVASRDVFEWDRARDDWSILAADAEIVDRCFVVPFAVRALVEGVLADDAIARALLARGNRVLAETMEAQRQQGRAEALEAVARQFERRLRRALTAAEHAELLRRLDTLGAARLGDVVLDLGDDALAAWLADADAR